MTETETGIALVQITGKCPHCEVRKYQIDTTEGRAMQIVSAAIDAHVREEHPDLIVASLPADADQGA